MSDRLKTSVRWRDLFSYVLGSLALGLVLAACMTAGQKTGPAVSASDRALSYIEGHDHLIGRYRGGLGGGESAFADSVREALTHMDRAGIRKMVVMPTPFAGNLPGEYRLEDFARIVQRHPGRFAFLGGGESLNVMLMRAADPEGVTPELKRAFEKRAEEILALGAAGFGEMAALHFSLHPSHPLEMVPPDHPLLRLLADIAARHGVPVDLHMEAVPADMPLPKGMASPPNPRKVPANLEAFERLLSHNRRASIIWAHAGWDNTGFRTVNLQRRLLATHPNLSMSIKITHHSLEKSRPLNRQGEIRPEWLDLLRSFPDRFFMGSDFKYALQRKGQSGTDLRSGTPRFLENLPPDLFRSVGTLNAERLFGLEG